MTTLKDEPALRAGVTARGITVSKFHLGGMKRESPRLRAGVIARWSGSPVHYMFELSKKEYEL